MTRGLRHKLQLFVFKRGRKVAIITALRAERRQGKRVNVFLDGRFAFSLEAEVALKENLEVSQELSAGQIDTLLRSDGYQRCLKLARAKTPNL